MTLRLRYQWLLLAAVVLGVYYPAIFGGYSAVDDVKLINRLLNLETYDIFSLFIRRHGYYYRPVTAATFYLDQYLWGAEALFMHVENLLVHLLNASLVFAVARRLCREAMHLPNWLPLLLAALFALHPVNAEAVCWISGRFDLLATTCVLASVWLLLWAFSAPSLWRMLPALLFAVVGCLAKETTLFYFGGAVCLVLAHFRQQAASYSRALRLALPGVLLWSSGAVVYLSIRRLGLSGHDSGVGMVLKAVEATAGGAGWVDHLRVAVKVAGFYLKKMFIPYPLNFAITDIDDIYLFVGILLVFVCVWLVRRADFPAAFFLGSILTGSAALLVVFGKMAWTPAAERYLYMPSALFVLGWAAWAAVCQEPRYVRWLKAVVACLLVVWGGMTIQRAHLWGDPLALMEDTVAKSPTFLPARKDLANYYLALGEKVKGQRLLESVKQAADKANYAAVDISLARQLAAAGQLEEAHRLLAAALENPGKRYKDLADLMLNINHQRIGKAQSLDQIREIHRENVQLLETQLQRKTDPFIEYLLAKEYLGMGDKERARVLFASAFRKAPEHAHYKVGAGKLAEKLAAAQHD